MENKTITICLGMILLSLVCVSAIETCKVQVDIKDATESVSVQIPLMINKTIIAKNMTIYQNALSKYYDNLRSWAKDKKLAKPVRPLVSIANVNKTIQVQATTNKTEYYIDFIGIKLLPHPVSVKLFTNSTQNVLKQGYVLNKDDGKIYTTKSGEDCK